MSEISLSGSLKVLQENPYGKWFGIAALGLVACTLLSVVAGQAGAVWLTVLLGLLAYAALAAVLFTVRRMVRAHRRERIRKQHDVE
ncbi:hypothetical protein [Sphaerisporangium corydalis]|uniref:Uncharacterized protein n=1 Tax=Sphaerisporangium corydalis TaxID=1441875 RepID=A0ABV9ELL6_9ACTN|nr:hypothetical protein [Sphaerisporangium corydalis]